MKIVQFLKKSNRTLLEMHIGILLCGVAAQLIGAFLVKDQTDYAISLWFGILLSCASAIHMYRSLDRALSHEASAAKLVLRDYMIRYVLLAVILCMIIMTQVMNPLVVFLAYMSLKVTAFIQPITHKFCNKIFHETDPVPQALPDEPAEEAAEREA